MEPSLAFSLVCPACGNTHRQTKHGRLPTGKQRFQCQNCKRRYVLDPQTKALDPALKEQAIRLYLEQNGFRRIARLLGVNPQTVANWVHAREQVQPPAPQPTEAEIIEMDELYALHQKKGSGST